jgi:hypothetical protein
MGMVSRAGQKLSTVFLMRATAFFGGLAPKY